MKKWIQWVLFIAYVAAVLMAMNYIACPAMRRDDAQRERLRGDAATESR